MSLYFSSTLWLLIYESMVGYDIPRAYIMKFQTIDMDFDNGVMEIS